MNPDPLTPTRSPSGIMTSMPTSRSSAGRPVIGRVASGAAGSSREKRTSEWFSVSPQNTCAEANDACTAHATIRSIRVRNDDDKLN
jgi:hypothetical protein